MDYKNLKFEYLFQLINLIQNSKTKDLGYVYQAYKRHCENFDGSMQLLMLIGAIHIDGDQLLVVEDPFSELDESTIRSKKKFRNLISFNGNKIVQYDKPNNIYKNTFLDNLIKNADETKKKDLILFGTGVSVLNIPDEIKSFFYKNSVKFEIMNSLAAYKTYNILLHESRNFISIIKVL